MLGASNAGSTPFAPLGGSGTVRQSLVGELPTCAKQANRDFSNQKYPQNPRAAAARTLGAAIRSLNFSRENAIKWPIAGRAGRCHGLNRLAAPPPPGKAPTIGHWQPP